MKYPYLIFLCVVLSIATATTTESTTPLRVAIWKRDNPKCHEIHQTPTQQQCQFSKTNCIEPEGIINYFTSYYCTFNFLHSFAIIPISVCLIICFVSLGITASEYLCPNLYTISKFLKLSDNLAGLTLLAFGNGAPDVLSTFHAINMDSSGLAIAELLGASLFIVTVVIGSIAVVNPFEVPQNLFIRDIVMYLSVILIVIVSMMIWGSLSIFVCLILVLIYILYVGLAVYSHSAKKRRILQLLRDQRSRAHFGGDAGVGPRTQDIDEVYLDNFATLPTIDELNLVSRDYNDTESLNMNEYDTFLSLSQDASTQGMVSASTGSYGLKMLLRGLAKHSNIGGGSIQISTERQLSAPASENNVVPTASNESFVNDGLFEKRCNKFLELICPQLVGFNESSLVVKLFMILSFPIMTILPISEIYNLSDDILGMTVFALGNSVGDFISNLTIARMGMPMMAFAACFGGPLLALCSLGFSGLVIIPKKTNELVGGYPLEMSRTLGIVCFGLVANLGLLIYVIPRNGWVLDKRIGTLLICNWFIATSLCILSEVL
ncbi:uncharacterized protein J8A68_005349 [[Candida] subhashii]|uniref:Sodium/calcium exchanger membrane region domain-containing protein n=1 Tax=[Candida] subhashii TaxID=561895 RepID=A0A8J5QHA8_9ASCO|nr:uncharacterized protein J8A68_005349 [[Candida] subhashii]KAG7661147.1 hypothetical protein J8A68_005349 [[Candida] subhashii]